MIKFLLILFIVFYLLWKVGGFLFRNILLKSFMKQQQANFQQGKQQQKQYRRPANGNVNVEFIPPESTSKGKTFKGGEYVDYEEIK